MSFTSALEEKLVDTQRLKQYAERMRSSVLINKVGFLLELNGIGAGDLLASVYRAGYVNIKRDSKGENKKWRVRYDR